MQVNGVRDFALGHDKIMLRKGIDLQLTEILSLTSMGTDVQIIYLDQALA